MAARVLVVDDEPGIADTLNAILAASGYESCAVYSATEALAILPKFQPHLVISDVVMPNMTGIELVSELRTAYPATIILLLSGNAATEELIAQADQSFESVVLLAKPFAPRQLLKIIAELTKDSDAA